MNGATQAKLWYWQRISAMLLALFVLVHLVTLVYAVRGGLTAAEILGRTRGSVLAAVFYSGFVLTAAVHAPIGLARVAEEWLGLKRRTSYAMALGFGVILAISGLRAVYAVVAW
jgi:fumarate reductase subunit C